MPYFCCVKGCSNVNNAGEGVTMHRIPIVPENDPDREKVELYARRRQHWIVQLQLQDISKTNPRLERRVCSKHFVKG